MSIEQKLVAETWATIKKKLPESVLRAGAKAGALEAIKINISRVLNGLDKNGKPFRKYSKNYPRAKQRAISKGKAGSGQYAAKSAGDKLRMTGQTLRSIEFTEGKSTQPTVGKINTKFTMYIRPDRAKIAQYLVDMGFDWFGVGFGSNKFRDEAAITRAVRQGMGVSGRSTLK